jgi:CheY-like chemotaxis protein
MMTIAPCPTTSPTAEVRERATVAARILVVDDDASVAGAVRESLSDLHAVVVETDPEAALGRLTAGERFDLILCDVMMPVLTGMDLHEAVRCLDAGQAARMAFMTGGAFTPRGRAFLADLSHPRLDKPFDPLDLRQFVADRLAAQASPPAPCAR